MSGENCREVELLNYGLNRINREKEDTCDWKPV
jgi:hypothetical protein